MKNSFRLTAIVLGSLTAPALHAEAFSAVELSSGYQQANTDPVQGAASTPKAAEKASEHKCGEGKCGEGKCGEGKCGEGQCGGAAPAEKSAEQAAEPKAVKEASCGGML